MKKLVKWLFGTRKKQLDIPVVIHSACPSCNIDMIPHKNETRLISGKNFKIYHTIQHYCSECGYISYPEHCV
jgi:hypothetical protein